MRYSEDLKEMNEERIHREKRDVTRPMVSLIAFDRSLLFFQ